MAPSTKMKSVLLPGQITLPNTRSEIFFCEHSQDLALESADSTSLLPDKRALEKFPQMPL